VFQPQDVPQLVEQECFEVHRRRGRGFPIKVEHRRVVGAFGGVLPWAVVWQIFLFNLVLKYAVTLISMPLIYVTSDRDWSEQ